MEFYNLISEYVKYDRMDVNFKKGVTEEFLIEKKQLLRDKIRIDILKISNSEELKRVIYDFQFILTPAEEFIIYNQYFSLVKNNREIVEKFIEVLYFWGPDYDNDISKIDDLLKKNKLEEISNLCMNIIY